MNTLSEHCYPIVREWRERFKIDQPSHECHVAMWNEEDQEQYDAATPEDVADAIGDKVFVWCGCMINTGRPIRPTYTEEWFWSYAQHTASTVGADLRRVVEMVAESNNSKLVTRAEIYPTRDKYAALGVECGFYDARDIGFYVPYVVHDCYGTDKKFYPAGKILKGVGFFEPKWTEDRSWIVG